MKQFFITLVLLFSFSLHSARPLSPTTILEQECFKQATYLESNPLAYYHSVMSARIKCSTRTTDENPKETSQKHVQRKPSLHTDIRNVANVADTFEDAIIPHDGSGYGPLMTHILSQFDKEKTRENALRAFHNEQELSDTTYAFLLQHTDLTVLRRIKPTPRDIAKSLFLKFADDHFRKQCTQGIENPAPTVPECKKLYHDSFIPFYIETSADQLLKKVGSNFSKLPQIDQEKLIKKVTQNLEENQGHVDLNHAYLEAFAHTLAHNTPLIHTFCITPDDSPAFSDLFLYNKFITFLNKRKELIRQAQANSKPYLLAIFNAYQNAYTDNHPPRKLAQITRNLLAQRQKMRREQARLDALEKECFTYQAGDALSVQDRILNNVERRQHKNFNSREAKKWVASHQ